MARVSTRTIDLSKGLLLAIISLIFVCLDPHLFYKLQSLLIFGLQAFSNLVSIFNLNKLVVYRSEFAPLSHGLVAHTSGRIFRIF